MRSPPTAAVPSHVRLVSRGRHETRADPPHRDGRVGRPRRPLPARRAHIVPHPPLGLDVEPPTRLRKTDRTGVFDFSGTGGRVKCAAGAEDARCACERRRAAVDELQVHNLPWAD